MKYSLLLIVLCLACVSVKQRPWYKKIYSDITVSGTHYKEDMVISYGMSYPLILNLWGSIGIWYNPYRKTRDPYWSLTYAFPVFVSRGQEDDD